MRSQLHHQPDDQGAGSGTGGQPSGAPLDYPVRDYVCAMSGELARMARWDGDERLACLLEVAAEIASKPRPRSGGAAI